MRILKMLEKVGLTMTTKLEDINDYFYEKNKNISKFEQKLFATSSTNIKYSSSDYSPTSVKFLEPKIQEFQNVLVNTVHLSALNNNMGASISNDSRILLKLSKVIYTHPGSCHLLNTLVPAVNQYNYLLRHQSHGFKLDRESSLQHDREVFEASFPFQNFSGSICLSDLRDPDSRVTSPGIFLQNKLHLMYANSLIKENFVVISPPKSGMRTDFIITHPKFYPTHVECKYFSPPLIVSQDNTSYSYNRLFSADGMTELVNLQKIHDMLSSCFKKPPYPPNYVLALILNKIPSEREFQMYKYLQYKIDNDLLPLQKSINSYIPKDAMVKIQFFGNPFPPQKDVQYSEQILKFNLNFIKEKYGFGDNFIEDLIISLRK